MGILIKMNSNNPLLISFFLLFYSANAFNITHILGQYPDFSTFNNLLTQTQLSAAINSRQTITVLAVDNAGLSPYSGKPIDLLKKIMSVHVVLDYYDVPKLQKLPDKTAMLTTLFQASGQASGQQGFLNISDSSTGSVVFGSAVPGSKPSANLVKSVASELYNISVLQISAAIVPTGIDGSPANSSSNSTAHSPQVSPGPSSNSTAKSPQVSPGAGLSPGKSTIPTPSTSPQMSPTTAAPQPSEAAPPSNATAGSPAGNAPTAEAASPSNATADSPTGDAPTAAVAGAVPVGSPPQPAEVPTADAPAAEAPARNSPSAAVALKLSLCAVLMILVSTFSLVSMT